MKSQASAKKAPSAKAPGPNWGALAARIVVGLVFIASGALKASKPPEEFAVVIDSYGLVSPGLSLSLAAFLPWIELLLGWSLLLGYFTREAAAAVFGLTIVFLGALGSIMARGIPLPNCGCFGGAVHLPIWASMLLDAVLAGLSYLAFRNAPGGPSLDNWCAPPHN